MPVLRHIEADESAIGATRDDHRKLFREANQGLQDRWACADSCPSGSESRLFVNRRLTLSIISEPAGFQNAWIADVARRGLELGESRGWSKICDVETLVADEGFLGQPVLGDLQYRGTRRDSDMARQENSRRGGHVLELIGDHVDGTGECGKCRLVVIGSERAQAGYLEGGAVGVWAVNVASQPELCRRHREHAGELAATQYADHSA